MKQLWRLVVAVAVVCPAVLPAVAGECGKSYGEMQPPNRERAESIVKKKCGCCHLGPWLDLRAYPFHSDRSANQQDLMAWFLERIEMEGWGRMPPVNAEPLTETEIQTLKQWYELGLPE